MDPSMTAYQSPDEQQQGVVEDSHAFVEGGDQASTIISQQNSGPASSSASTATTSAANEDNVVHPEVKELVKDEPETPFLAQEPPPQEQREEYPSESSGESHLSPTGASVHSGASQYSTNDNEDSNVDELPSVQTEEPKIAIAIPTGPAGVSTVPSKAEAAVDLTQPTDEAKNLVKTEEQQDPPKSSPNHAWMIKSNSNKSEPAQKLTQSTPESSSLNIEEHGTGEQDRVSAPGHQPKLKPSEPETGHHEVAIKNEPARVSAPEHQSNFKPSEVDKVPHGNGHGWMIDANASNQRHISSSSSSGHPMGENYHQPHYQAPSRYPHQPAPAGRLHPDDRNRPLRPGSAVAPENRPLRPASAIVPENPNPNHHNRRDATGTGKPHPPSYDRRFRVNRNREESDLIGKSVARTFQGHGCFAGSVSAYIPQKDKFEVIYTDGDTEELTISELQQIIIRSHEPWPVASSSMSRGAMYSQRGAEENRETSSAAYPRDTAPAASRKRMQPSSPTTTLVEELDEFFITYAAQFLAHLGWVIDPPSHDGTRYSFLPGVNRNNGKFRVDYFDTVYRAIAYLETIPGFLDECFPQHVQGRVRQLCGELSKISKIAEQHQQQQREPFRARPGYHHSSSENEQASYRGEQHPQRQPSHLNRATSAPGGAYNPPTSSSDEQQMHPVMLRRRYNNSNPAVTSSIPMEMTASNVAAHNHQHSNMKPTTAPHYVTETRPSITDREPSHHAHHPHHHVNPATGNADSTGNDLSSNDTERELQARLERLAPQPRSEVLVYAAQNKCSPLQVLQILEKMQSWSQRSQNPPPPSSSNNATSQHMHAQHPPHHHPHPHPSTSSAHKYRPPSPAMNQSSSNEDDAYEQHQRQLQLERQQQDERRYHHGEYPPRQQPQRLPPAPNAAFGRTSHHSTTAGAGLDQQHFPEHPTNSRYTSSSNVPSSTNNGMYHSRYSPPPASTHQTKSTPWDQHQHQHPSSSLSSGAHPPQSHALGRTSLPSMDTNANTRSNDSSNNHSEYMHRRPQYRDTTTSGTSEHHHFQQVPPPAQHRGEGVPPPHHVQSHREGGMDMNFSTARLGSVNPPASHSNTQPRGPQGTGNYTMEQPRRFIDGPSGNNALGNYPHHLSMEEQPPPTGPPRRRPDASTTAPPPSGSGNNPNLNSTLPSSNSSPTSNVQPVYPPHNR